MSFLFPRIDEVEQKEKVDFITLESSISSFNGTVKNIKYDTEKMSKIVRQCEMQTERTAANVQACNDKI